MDLYDNIFKMDQTQTLFGRQVLQSWASFAVYEQLLNAHKERISWIVEIGTATGLTTLYLAQWAWLTMGPQRRILVTTIDSGVARHAWPLDADVQSLLNFLQVQIVIGDVFKPATFQIVKSVIVRKPGLLFCDGGDKDRELRTFGPIAARGTIIIAHDWPIEVNEKDVAATEGVDYYQPWHDQSLGLGTKAAILVRERC